MQLLFRVWNHLIPLAIVTNKTLKQGDIIEIRKTEILYKLPAKYNIA